MAFLVLKPIVDLNQVPELFKLLLSSSIEHHQRERQWMLQLLSESLLEPFDYHVIDKR
jgi:hypothetical protein